LRTAPPPIPVTAGNGDTNAPPPLPSSAGLLAWMVRCAIADGTVDAKELELLTTVGQRRNVPRSRIEEMIRAALRNELAAPQPSNATEAREWLGGMIQAAMADGNLSSAEQQMIQSTARGLGMSDYDLQMLVKSTRSEMLAQARDALRR